MLNQAKVRPSVHRLGAFQSVAHPAFGRGQGAGGVSAGPDLFRPDALRALRHAASAGPELVRRHRGPHQRGHPGDVPFLFRAVFLNPPGARPGAVGGIFG